MTLGASCGGPDDCGERRRTGRVRDALLVSLLALLLSACTDPRNLLDYGVCSFRHQGCGQ
jgi:hypothetical protein